MTGFFLDNLLRGSWQGSRGAEYPFWVPVLMNTAAMFSARTFPTERSRQEASGMSSVWPIERGGVDPLYHLGHPQVQLVASRQGEAADQGLADELVGEDERGSGPSLAAT